MFERVFERTWLQIKGMKTMFVIPFIGYYCLIPLAVWGIAKTSEYLLIDIVSDVCYLFVPILATWWGFMIQREYIEGDGREVLLLGGGMIPSTILFWLMNAICISTISLFVENDIQNSVTTLTCELITISFFMCGLSFFLNFYTKSILVSVLAVLFYTALSNYTFYNDQVINIFEPFQLTVLKWNELFSPNYYKFFIAGVIFWLIGAYKSRRIE